MENQLHMLSDKQRLLFPAQVLTNIASFALSAFLLFWLEPLIAKILLPHLGGVPMVWLTCSVFYQFVLLIGYMYAHVLTKWLSFKSQIIIHLIIVSATIAHLPLYVISPNIDLASQHVAFDLFWMLIFYIGPPFFLVCTTAPLLQKWFSYTHHPDACDPYYLYATSNVGSLLALVAFPFMMEPLIGIKAQMHYWSIGLGVAMVCLVASMLINLSLEKPKLEKTIQSGHIPLKDKCMWVLYAFIPSSLLLGCTHFITTDIAPIPLLWVLPLMIYLLTFIIAFSQKPLITQKVTDGLMPFMMVLVLLTLPYYPHTFLTKTGSVLCHLTILFFVALHFHHLLVSSRPNTAHLTLFYIFLALGGFLGGAFNTFLSPLIFDSFYEYPLVLMLACFLYTPFRQIKHSYRDYIWLIAFIGIVLSGYAIQKLLIPDVREFYVTFYALIVLLTTLLANRVMAFSLTTFVLLVIGYLTISPIYRDYVHSERNFFDSLKVIDFDNRYRGLISGTTTHGVQFVGEDTGYLATYYHPLTMTFWEYITQKERLDIGIAGLGIGTVSCLLRKSDHVDFFEINPSVIRIAKDEKFFTVLKECPVRDIKLVDARIGISKMPDASYDVIVMDAFSSDAIPIHLLTYEAIAIYLKKLKTNGAIMFHITNRHVDLSPVLQQIAKQHGLYFAEYVHIVENRGIHFDLSSMWVCLTRNPNLISVLEKRYHWQQNPERPLPPLWTDDFSNILSVLKIN